MRIRECGHKNVLTSRDGSDNHVTEQLGRIWDDYPNGLLDLTDAKVAELDSTAPAVEALEVHDEEEEEMDRSKLMPFHEMSRLRDSLFDQLK